MEVYFLRHGIAEDLSPTRKDADRALTEEGVKRMKKAALGMRRLELTFDAVVSSPLVRARQTAELAIAGLGHKGTLRFSDALTPEAEFGDLLNLLSEFPENARVLVVGHQPSMADFVSRLISPKGEARIEVKKGSLTRVDLDGDGGVPRGILQWAMPSRILRALS